MKDHLQDRIIQIQKQIEALQGVELIPSAVALEVLKDSLEELKSAEEIYRQGDLAYEPEEGALSQMISLSPDRFFRQDRELRYTWISHASLFGHPSSKLIGKTSFEIFSPEGSLIVFDGFINDITDKKPVQMEELRSALEGLGKVKANLRDKKQSKG